MAYQTCEFCGGTVNGYTKLLEHQSHDHPKEYTQLRIKGIDTQIAYLQKQRQICERILCNARGNK